MSIELDHVFWVMSRANANTIMGQLARLGLRESYRRRHIGQGTANVCYCFENAFLELLWIDDPVAVQSPPIRRLNLAERNTGAAHPMGLAWRGLYKTPTWPFAPPYLPEGVTIPVATLSDNSAMPLIFTFPGSKPISDPAMLQTHSGYDRLSLTHVGVSVSNRAELQALARTFDAPFAVDDRHSPMMIVTLTGPSKAVALRFERQHMRVMKLK